MKFTKYLKDQINYILVFITYCIIIIGYLNIMEVDPNIKIVLITISTIIFIAGLIITYIKKNRYIKNISSIIEHLDEKYLISEVMEKPKRQENIAYYKILKKATKSMLEKVSKVIETQREYKEYIESWVHEIKIPITSVKLLCENNKSEVTLKIDEETEEINNYVEQALFYARLDQVSNDFMIKEIKLADTIKTVISRNKKIMIQNNMKVETKNIDINVYSDEKWLEFIINQIIVNSIKYKKENNAKIDISACENKENIKLKIRDNGIGIKKSEINRIFDKGFTGTNGRIQKRSTGIGLYLCKRLCEELGMKIEVESIENEYTELIITIPKDRKLND